MQSVITSWEAPLGCAFNSVPPSAAQIWLVRATVNGSLGFVYAELKILSRSTMRRSVVAVSAPGDAVELVGKTVGSCVEDVAVDGGVGAPPPGDVVGGGGRGHHIGVVLSSSFFVSVTGKTTASVIMMSSAASIPTIHRSLSLVDRTCPSLTGYSSTISNDSTRSGRPREARTGTTVSRRTVSLLAVSRVTSCLRSTVFEPGRSAIGNTRFVR